MCENWILLLGSQKENEENYIPQLKKCGLHKKLQNALKYLTWNAKSLLQNKDSNRVETFNSVISKWWKKNYKRIISV